MSSCDAGELGALEEVVGQLVTRGLMKPMTLKALWFICSNAHDQLTASVSWQTFREICVNALLQSAAWSRQDFQLSLSMIYPHGRPHDSLQQSCHRLQSWLATFTQPNVGRVFEPAQLHASSNARQIGVAPNVSAYCSLKVSRPCREGRVRGFYRRYSAAWR